MCVTAPINSGLVPSAVTSITPSKMLEGAGRVRHLQPEPSPWRSASTSSSNGTLQNCLLRCPKRHHDVEPELSAQSQGHGAVISCSVLNMSLNHHGPCQHTQPSHVDDAAWQRVILIARQETGPLKALQCDPALPSLHGSTKAQLLPPMSLSPEEVKHRAGSPVRRPLRPFCKQCSQLSCLHGQSLQ